MKYSTRHLTLIAIAALVAITAYQAYWLVNIYHTLDSALLNELQEVVRAADFEEIVHRVNTMRDENYGGKMDVSVGVDSTLQKTTLRNESKRRMDDEDADTNLDMDVKSEFPDALREADDVMNVGLNMQRAIHSGLDRLRQPDLKYFEQAVERRLDSLDIDVPHAILYLRCDTLATDTLAKMGDCVNGKTDQFIMRLDINEGTEYQLLVSRRPWVVFKRMNAMIVLSLLTLFMLILAFGYAWRLAKRLKAIDEMKTEFSNNITHELKTPIAVAYAANDALLNFDAAKDPETMRNYLNISLDQLNLLSQLVEQILALTTERQEKVKLRLEDVNVGDTVAKLVKMHQLKAGGKVYFDIQIDPKLTLHTDRMHFSNIVSNLIDNAVKYSEGEAHVAIHAHADNNKIHIGVTDQGIGISHAHLPYVFDRFYRVPHGNLHNVKGYGLGLYYVKSMTERLGGKVAVHSKEGGGSTFSLTFVKGE